MAIGLLSRSNEVVVHARALAGGVFFLVVVAASLGSDDDPSLPVLALHVTAPEEVSSATLQRAAQEVSMIYGAAGVKTVWLGPASRPSTRVDAVVVIIVLSGTTAAGRVAELGLRHEDLGYAIGPAQRAYVLWSRIRDVELQFSRDSGEVLGLVIAHEIGHLLLRDDSHSLHGIMRPELDLRSRHRPHFTQPQTERIRAALAPGTVGESMNGDVSTRAQCSSDAYGSSGGVAGPRVHDWALL